MKIIIETITLPNDDTTQNIVFYTNAMVELHRIEWEDIGGDELDVETVMLIVKNVIATLLVHQEKVLDFEARITALENP